MTGTPAAIDAMRQTWRIYARKVPGKGSDYTLDHAALVYVLDREGHFAGTLPTGRPIAEQAAMVLKALAGKGL
jgi:protein SCO1/2